MKKNMIAAGIALAMIAGYYVIRKVLKKEQPEQPPRSHHLTDVFSKAKDLAMHN